MGFIYGALALYFGLDILLINFIPSHLIYVFIGGLGLLIILTPIAPPGTTVKPLYKVFKFLFGLVLMVIGVTYYFEIPFISYYNTEIGTAIVLIAIGVVYLISLSKKLSDLELSTV